MPASFPATAPAYDPPATWARISPTEYATLDRGEIFAVFDVPTYGDDLAAALAFNLADSINGETV